MVTSVRCDRYSALCLADTCGVVHRFDYTTDMVVCRPSHVFFFITHLRFSSVFSATSLMFVTGYSINKDTVGIIYSFLLNDRRFTVLSPATEKHQVDSIKQLYYNAWWYERETSEMLGTKFLGSTDSRNLLLPYGFAGHPLKKDVANNYSYTLRFEGDAVSLRWVLL